MRAVQRTARHSGRVRDGGNGLAKTVGNNPNLDQRFGFPLHQLKGRCDEARPVQ
jgi:hypothetical protein